MELPSSVTNDKTTLVIWGTWQGHPAISGEQPVLSPDPPDQGQQAFCKGPDSECSVGQIAKLSILLGTYTAREKTDFHKFCANRIQNVVILTRYNFCI